MAIRSWKNPNYIWHYSQIKNKFLSRFKEEGLGNIYKSRLCRNWLNSTFFEFKTGSKKSFPSEGTRGDWRSNYDLISSKEEWEKFYQFFLLSVDLSEYIKRKKPMKYITKLKLAAVYKYCQEENKSKAFTLNMMQHITDVDHDCALNFYGIDASEKEQLNKDNAEIVKTHVDIYD